MGHPRKTDNRRSFDCVTHDDVVSHFAQDDNSAGATKLRMTAGLAGGGYAGSRVRLT
jgi:hypothetical protein